MGYSIYVLVRCLSHLLYILWKNTFQEIGKTDSISLIFYLRCLPTTLLLYMYIKFCLMEVV